ncbi:MAG: hypothetical protein R3F13_21910 [Prosthecobacter sp.]
MVTSATQSSQKTPAGSEQSSASDITDDRRAMAEQMEQVIATELPGELRPSALELLRAIMLKVAVAEHFDAFCGQAFAKPEWAAAASPVLADLFEEDEDLLAELARIPDLIIEMGTGQVAITCMVASRWAARGETHRLSRLADALVASHACKSACAVEVMLALAATLAVTRLSRAEQLFQAALPLVKDEHAEAVADARKWLAVGRVVCSTSQEERDFWDVRLRRPKTAWQWDSQQERHALANLAEQVRPNLEGAESYQAIVPECWWDLAMSAATTKEAENTSQKRDTSAPIASDRETSPPTPEVPKRPHPDVVPIPEKPRQVSRGRSLFVLGWTCGALTMALTILLLPQHIIGRLVSFNEGTIAPTGAAPALTTVVKGPAEMEAWRQENLRRMKEDMAEFAAQQMVAKNGTWRESEKVLLGHTERLPHDSSEYVKFLVWLHLDPPEDSEVRRQVAKLLLERVNRGAITLWEELSYPGSANAREIRDAALAALTDATFTWSDTDKARLKAIVAITDGNRST